jgi:kynurenine formamidase
MPLADLSHPFGHGTITYPGLPGPLIGDHMSFEDSHGRYADGVEFAITRIEMVANTGTYLDTPAHRLRDGYDLAGLPLERVAGVPGVVVDTDQREIGPERIPLHEPGTAVLFRTGWSRHWGTERYGAGGHPHLTAAAVEVLVDQEAAVVGIDSINIDDTSGGERPAHTGLLAAGIPIVEHLTNLQALPHTFEFYAVPPKVSGMASFPVRAFARW